MHGSSISIIIYIYVNICKYNCNVRISGIKSLECPKKVASLPGLGLQESQEGQNPFFQLLEKSWKNLPICALSDRMLMDFWWIFKHQTSGDREMGDSPRFSQSCLSDMRDWKFAIPNILQKPCNMLQLPWQQSQLAPLNRSLPRGFLQSNCLSHNASLNRWPLKSQVIQNDVVGLWCIQCPCSKKSSNLS